MRETNLLIVYLNLIIVVWFQSVSVEGIIGGADAKIGRPMLTVSIVANGEHICSGAIIDDFYVLSAAHCFITSGQELKNADYSVISGVVDIADVTFYKAHVNVEYIYIPAEYYRIVNHSFVAPTEDITGDIAVLKLKKKLGLGKNTILSQPILPSTYSLYEEEKPIVSGFGYNTKIVHRDSKGDERLEFKHDRIKLKYAGTTIITNSRCSSMHDNNPIYRTQLCAQVDQHDQNNPEGVCKGDSGGPLILGKEIIGILSEGPRNCNESTKAAIYTRIAYFMPFIRTVLKLKANEKSDFIRVAGYIIKKKWLKKNQKILVEL